MATNLITQDRLKSLLTYDPCTGIFTRRVKVKNQPAGTVVGTVLNNGYLACSIDKKMYKLHRLAWFYVHGKWPINQIDHINCVTNDNRIENLREATSAQNHQNRSRRTKSLSGYLGVTWHTRDKKWQAHIEVDGKAIHLGYHTDLDAAVKARKIAETQHHPFRPN